MRGYASNVDKASGISFTKKLLNTKRIAFALIGTAQQSVITMPMLAGMMTVDGLLHFYLVIMQILRQQEDPTILNFLNVINYYTEAPLTSYGQIVIQVLISVFFLCIILSFAVIARYTHSLSTLHQSPGLKSAMTFVFVSLMTYLQIPLLELTIGSLFVRISDSQNSLEQANVLKIILYLLSGVNLAALLGFVFLLQKLFIIRIPSLTIHWAASNTQLHSMKSLNKILLVVTHLYVTTNVQSGLYLTVPALILFTATGFTRLLVIPHYRALVDWLTRLTELVTACLLVVLIITQMVGNGGDHRSLVGGGKADMRLALLVSFLVIPCVIALAIVVDQQRQRQLWDRLERGELKMEIEYEHAMYLMIERVKAAMGTDDRSTLAFADILYLVENHSQSCQNNGCACKRTEIVQYMLSKGYLYGANKIILKEDEINLLNSSLNQEFIQSNKNPSKMKTLTMFQNFNFYTIELASGRAAEPEPCLIESSKRNTQGIGLKQGTLGTERSVRVVTHRDINQVKVNVGQLKLTFMNQFAEIFFEDARRRFPDSKRLFFQYAYFTLQCCRNRFMTETLLRNFEANETGSSQKVPWIEQVSIMVNELQTIMEIERLEDIKNGRQSAAFNNEDDDSMAPSDTANWGVTYLKNGQDRDDNLENGSTKSGIFSAMQTFDPEYFIIMSDLTSNFYEEVERLAFSVSNFWKIVQSDTLEVESLYKESSSLSNIIAQIYDVFKDIESASESGSGTGRSTDFKVIYTFALLQRSLLNDLVQYELYTQKMNSQREMIRLLQNNMLSQVKGPENTGFMLVHGQNKRFGKIIMCNQIIRGQLGFSSKEISHMSIVDFMPKLIKNWHQGFVQDFIKNGGASNGILNKTTCLFMRRKNGYVVPAMVNVRFHYQKDHEFTFVCFVHFMKDIQISKASGTGRHRTQDILFFLCDDQEGRIFDLSESCSKQLGFSVDVLYNHDMENQASNFNIEDICPNLSFKKMKALRGEADGLADAFGGAIEQVVDLDLNVIQNSSMGNHQASLNGDGRGIQKIQKALCQVFQEQYGVGRDKKMNIVAMVLLDQIAMREFIKSKRKARNDQRDRQIVRREDNRLLSLNANQQPEGAQGSRQESPGQNIRGTNSEQDGASGSQSSQTHSSNTGTSETSMLKQLYQSTDKTASSSLKLITQMIAVVFVLLLVVSTLNLLLSLTRNDQLQLEVQTVRRSYDRLAIHSKSRLLLRGLLNMANGYEPMNQSEITQDRFSLYMKELELQVMRLKDVQDFMDRVDFEYSDGFRKQLDSKIIPLEYLDVKNEPIFQDQTFSYAMNLFIQRASLLSTWNIQQFRGNVKSIQQIGTLQSGYNPTEDERTLYFLVQAGSGKMRSVSKILSDRFRQETVDHALSVASQTQLTIIISIVAIIIVTGIISPILCRIEQRKYTGLKFFLNVDPSHLEILEDQVQDFLQQAFSDASVHTGATSQELNVIKDKKKLRKQQNRNGEVLQSAGSSHGKGSQSSSSVDAARDQAEAEMDECESDTFASGLQSSNLQQTIKNDFLSVKQSQNAEQNHQAETLDAPGLVGEQFNRVLNRSNYHSTQVATGQAFMEKDVKKAQTKKYKDEKVKQVDLKEQDSHKETMKGKINSAENQLSRLNQQNSLSLRGDSLRGSDAKEDKFDDKSYAQQQEEAKLQTEEAAEARQILLDIKFTRIQQIAQQQKYKTLLGIFMLATVLSSYFIAGYFFSVNSFSQTPDILQHLDTIFFKDVSLEISIAFIRQNQMSNESIRSVEDPTMSGADYYLSRSEGREKAYLEIRRKFPSLFTQIKSYIDGLETSELCTIASKGDQSLQIDRYKICKRVYHGVMQNGLTYTMNLIMNHFRNVNLRFKGMPPQNRTLDFLKEGLSDLISLQLIEIKDFVLDNVFYDLKDVVTQCTTSYYSQLIKQYTTLYAIFIVLMTALFLGYLIFGYSHIKDTMWKTNLTLKIMPLDFIPRHCLPELKAFFRY